MLAYSPLRRTALESELREAVISAEQALKMAAHRSKMKATDEATRLMEVLIESEEDGRFMSPVHEEEEEEPLAVTEHTIDEAGEHGIVWAQERTAAGQEMLVVERLVNSLCPAGDTLFQLARPLRILSHDCLVDNLPTCLLVRCFLVLSQPSQASLLGRHSAPSVGWQSTRSRVALSRLCSLRKDH